MQADNSARCLHNILKTAMLCDPQDMVIALALAPGLKIQNPQLEKHKYIDFLTLIREVEHDVSKLKVDELDEYLKGIREIGELFLMHRLFEHSWSSISPVIQQSRLLLTLNSCALFIDQQIQYPTLDNEKLEKYMEECQNLIKDVLNSDLEDSIKTFLIIRLQDICLAIQNYHLGGTEKLKKIIEENIGGLLLRTYGLAPEERKKPIYQTLLQWLLTFGGLLDTASNMQGYLLPKAIEIAQHLLPPH